MSGSVQDAENKKSCAILPSWFEIGAVTALLLPLCYTAGWSYAYHYFERFNLGLMGLDIPKEYFFVYSFQALRDQLWLFLFSVLLFAALLVFGRILLERLKRRFTDQAKGKMLTVIPATLLPLLIFALFLLFYQMGENAAVNVYERQVQHDFDAYLRVQVWVNAPENAEYGAEMARAWQQGCYRLLMRSEDHVFVFQPLQSGGKIPTDMIPADRVELIRMLPVNTSCQ